MGKEPWNVVCKLVGAGAAPEAPIAQVIETPRQPEYLDSMHGLLVQPDLLRNAVGPFSGLQQREYNAVALMAVVAGAWFAIQL